MARHPSGHQELTPGPLSTLLCPRIPTPPPLGAWWGCGRLGAAERGGNVTSHPVWGFGTADGEDAPSRGRRRGQGQILQSRRLAKELLDEGRSVWEGSINPAEGSGER